MPRRSRILISLGALAIVESILRLVFFYLGTYGGAQLITPPPPEFVTEFINAFSLLLGIAGLVVIPALLLSRTWGYWGSIILSVVTIGFDGWAVATTAWTAIAGIVIPILVLSYLIPKKRAFTHRLVATSNRTTLPVTKQVA